MGTQRAARQAVAVAVAVLLIGACSGGDDDSGAGSTVAPTPPAVSEASPPPSDATPPPSDATPPSSAVESLPSTPEADDRLYGGDVVYSIGTEMNTLDPLGVAAGTSGNNRAIQIFETLFRVDPDGNLAPSLALSMDSDDGATWTIKLRPGVNFSDGTPLDADAVVYNIDRQRNAPDTFVFKGNVENITSVEAIDLETVEITLSEPSGSFPFTFTSVNGLMASPTAVEADPEGFGDNPVGAGPFLLDEWVRDDHMTLVRNPDYWDAPRPYLDSITVRILPQQQSWIDTILSGESHIVAARPDVIAATRNEPEIQYAALSPVGGEFVTVNQQWEPGSDKRLREAIALAFDPAIVEEVFTRGAWPSQELVCPPFLPGSPECLEGVWPKPDPARAAELIQEWLADGNSPDVELLSTSSVAALNEFLQQTLNGIGLNVSINAGATADYAANINAGNYQLAWGALPAFDNPYPRVFQQFASTGGRWLGRADLPELDDALARGRDALSADDRAAAYQDFQRIVAEEFIVGWFAPFVTGLAVRNVDVGSQGPGVDYHMVDFSLIEPE
ncbi:MAG TPA: ABC transporter substrate-binding protein [Ilumatobacter sp.]|nr:ABC transporter substrate-binding protein [Ilumatobacter sp.]